MSIVIAPSNMAREVASGREEETLSHLTTTLFDLMAAIQDVVGPEDDALAVATMVHLLQSGRLTWLPTDRALRCEAHGAVAAKAQEEGQLQ